jgi:hypothetical protein
MLLDADTFLVTVYVLVDDLYRTEFGPQKPSRPGPAPAMSDSEVLTLALLGQWRQDQSERAFVAWVRRHWQAYFPRMLSQSAFNRRVRDLHGVLLALGPRLHAALAWWLQEDPLFEVLDAVPVSLMRRCRGERHRVFAPDEAAVGRGGSDRAWYYGVSLLDAVSPAGTITGFVVGPANTEGRWLAESLLRWRDNPTAPPPTAEELEYCLGRCTDPKGRRGPTGRLGARGAAGYPGAAVYLGDGGFAGKYWRPHWRADYGVELLTTLDAPATATPRERRAYHHWYASHRQVIERVHNLLLGTFGLAFPKARSYWGLITRLAAKVAAYNLLITLNYRFGRDTFSVFNPLD